MGMQALTGILPMVAMGAYFARRGKTTDDFFLAGRRIPWWAATLSIFSTQLSAITFMAIPGKAYATDWVSILMNLGIILVSPLIVFWFLPFFCADPWIRKLRYCPLRSTEKSAESSQRKHAISAFNSFRKFLEVTPIFVRLVVGQFLYVNLLQG